MSVAIFFLIFIAVLVAVILCCVAVAYKTAPTRQSRREKELGHLVYRLREIAYQSRDVEPNLSFLITDEIEKFNQRELN